MLSENVYKQIATVIRVEMLVSSNESHCMLKGQQTREIMVRLWSEQSVTHI